MYKSWPDQIAYIGIAFKEYWCIVSPFTQGGKVRPPCYDDIKQGARLADMIALSALLTKTMPAMKRAVKAVKEAGMTTRTIIGGAPVTRAFTDLISANGYSADAPAAVKLAKELVA